MRHETDEPGMLLERHQGAKQALALLRGLVNTEERERSSIFSAAADALDAYSSYGALDAAQDPNFDPALFVRSNDTVYIHAPARAPGRGRAAGVRALGGDPPRDLRRLQRARR